MHQAPAPDLEEPSRRHQRLRALQRLDVLGTLPETIFDMVTASALAALRGETALLTLVGEDRQFFKSAAGAVGEMVARRRDGPLTHSFCRFVVETDDVLSIEDAARDPHLCNHPGYVEDGVVAYLGAPVRVDGGVPVGSLCVTGTATRIWTEAEARTVTSLATLAGELLQHRAELRTQDRLLETVGGAPVFVTGAAGRILFWSADCERVFGWTAAEARGGDARDLLGLPDAAHVPGAATLRHRDGTHLRLSLRQTLFDAGAGGPAVAHECLGRVAVAPRREGPGPQPPPPPDRTPPARRHIADALQILQSVSDVVVRQLAEQAARDDHARDAQAAHDHARDAQAAHDHARDAQAAHDQARDAQAAQDRARDAQVDRTGPASI